jgi:hypothetical protein
VAADGNFVDLQKRGTPVWKPEQALERDRVVEIAAHLEEPSVKRVDAGELTLTQAHPGVSARAHGHVGLTAGPSLADPGAVLGATNLPGASDVAKADLVRGVKARIRAQIPIGK